MTKDELMRARFKVIADYPKQIYQIGDILVVFDTVNDCENYKGNGIAILNETNELQKYPVIFKSLQWWEDRDRDDLPKYIKDEDGDVVRLMAVAPHTKSDEYVTHDELFQWSSLYNCEPSSEDEYFKYINNKEK